MVIDTGVFIEHLRAKVKLHTTLFVPAGSLEKDPALDAYMKHKHPMPGRLRQTLLGRETV